jgi:hypothetical protein
MQRRNIVTKKFDPDEFSATDIRIALNEVFPEASYGAIPLIDQYDTLEAYLAFDDSALAEAPQALAAYITSLQHCAVQVARAMQRPPRPDNNHRVPNLPSTK